CSRGSGSGPRRTCLRLSAAPASPAPARRAPPCTCRPPSSLPLGSRHPALPHLRRLGTACPSCSFPTFTAGRCDLMTEVPEPRGVLLRPRCLSVRTRQRLVDETQDVPRGGPAPRGPGGAGAGR